MARLSVIKCICDVEKAGQGGGATANEYRGDTHNFE